MIFFGWMLIAVCLIALGLAMLHPKRIMDLIQPKYYCSGCLKSLGDAEKFRANFEAGNSLEGRQT